VFILQRVKLHKHDAPELMNDLRTYVSIKLSNMETEVFKSKPSLNFGFKPFWNNEKVEFEFHHHENVIFFQVQLEDEESH